MFVYESGNSLNLTFKGSIPVETPDVVIKGYKDGATVTIAGTTYGTASEEFEGKASTLVFQSAGKLMITFKGISGMETPDVTLDEVSAGVVNVTVGDTSIVVEYTDSSVSVKESAPAEEEPAKTEEPKTEPEDIPEDVEEGSGDEVIEE